MQCKQLKHLISRPALSAFLVLFLCLIFSSALRCSPPASIYSLSEAHLKVEISFPTCGNCLTYHLCLTSHLCGCLHQLCHVGTTGHSWQRTVFPFVLFLRPCSGEQSGVKQRERKSHKHAGSVTAISSSLAFFIPSHCCKAHFLVCVFGHICALFTASSLAMILSFVFLRTFLAYSHLIYCFSDPWILHSWWYCHQKRVKTPKTRRFCSLVGSKVTKLMGPVSCQESQKEGRAQPQAGSPSQLDTHLQQGQQGSWVSRGCWGTAQR